MAWVVSNIPILREVGCCVAPSRFAFMRYLYGVSRRQELGARSKILILPKLQNLQKKRIACKNYHFTLRVSTYAHGNTQQHWHVELLFGWRCLFLLQSQGMNAGKWCFFGALVLKELCECAVCTYTACRWAWTQSGEVLLLNQMPNCSRKLELSSFLELRSINVANVPL